MDGNIIKSKLIKFTDNYYGKAVITGLFIFITYLFYLLGYSFLYGYYFGGNFQDIINPVNILVNQVPLDFKYISVLGLIVFIFCSIWLTLVIYINVNRTFFKLVCILLYILLFLLINRMLEFLHISASNLDMDVLIVSFLIFTIISVLKYILRISFVEKYILSKLIIVLIYTIILIQLVIKMATSVPESYQLIVFLTLIIIGDYLIDTFCIFYESKKSRAMLIEIGLLFIAIQIKFSIFLVVLAFIVFIEVVKKLTYQKIQLKIPLKFKETGKKSKVEFNLKASKIAQYNIFKKFTNLLEVLKKENVEGVQKKSFKVFLMGFILSWTAVSFIVIYLIVFCLMSSFGNYVGEELHINKYSKIAYMYNQNNVEIEGLVVKQSGNTYYISTKDRVLEIISSINISILEN